MSIFDIECERPEPYKPDDALRTSSDCARQLETVVSALWTRIEDLIRAIDTDMSQVINQLRRKIGTYQRDTKKGIKVVDEALALYIANLASDASTFLSAVLSDAGIDVAPVQLIGIPAPAQQPVRVEWTPLTDPGTANARSLDPTEAADIARAAGLPAPSVLPSPTAAPANLPPAAPPINGQAAAAPPVQTVRVSTEPIAVAPGQNVINIPGANGCPPIQLVINLTVNPAPVYMMPQPQPTQPPDLLEGLTGPRGGADTIPIPVDSLSASVGVTASAASPPNVDVSEDTSAISVTQLSEGDDFPAYDLEI